MVRVRLPTEVERAARSLCKMTGMSMSAFIRSGIEAHLAQIVPEYVRIAEDSNMPARERFRVLNMLRKLVWAGLALHGPKVVLDAHRRVSNARR